MNKKELMKKVNANEGLTVEEIIEYQKIVKPIKHVYGKYGNLALEYLKEHSVGKYWTLISKGELPTYLHNVDKQADRLYIIMYNKLSNSPKLSKTGEYVHDLQVETEKQRIIEEEILNKIVYVE
ncbi:MAG: TnpV protein [Clostridiales bacterium]|nr:TnpV protein [Clostridiales bacterium]